MISMNPRGRPDSKLTKMTLRLTTSTGRKTGISRKHGCEVSSAFEDCEDHEEDPLMDCYCAVVVEDAGPRNR